MANRQGSSDKRLNGWERKALRARFLRSAPLCAHCEARGIVRAATELDHITPLNRGGSHDWSNLQGLCADCHKAKSRSDMGRPPKGCDENGVPFAGWD